MRDAESNKHLQILHTELCYLVDKYLLASAENGMFEFSLTDYSEVDLKGNEQCPLSSLVQF